MSYMSGLIVQMSGLDEFVAGWNAFGKQQFLDAGATNARLSQSVMAGEGAGNVAVSSRWDSIDKAMEAASTIRANPETAAMMKSAGVQTLRRSLLAVQAERGTSQGKYGTMLTGIGDPATPEQLRANADTFYGHMQDSVNGITWMQAVAAGPMTGNYVTISMCDSLDQLMEASQKMFAMPEIRQMMASQNFQLTGRSMFKVLG
jgi:hypothetical protein